MRTELQMSGDRSMVETTGCTEDKNKALRELATVIAPVAEMLSHSVVIKDENRQELIQPISQIGVVLKDSLSAIDSAFNQQTPGRNGEDLADWYVSQTVLDNVCDIYNVMYDSEEAKRVLAELIQCKREKHRGKSCSEVIEGQEVLKDFSRDDAGLKVDSGKLDTNGFVVEYMYPRALFTKHVVQVNSQGVNVDDTEALLHKIGLAWVTREEHEVLEKRMRKGITVFNDQGELEVGPYEEIFAEYNAPSKAEGDETVKLLHIVENQIVAVSGN